MSEQYVPKLGELIDPDDPNARRDAIHLAVAPLVAGEDLECNAFFRVDGGLAYHAMPDEAVGVVDPFLRKWVKKGERFWGCVFPGTVTGLRHLWQHPAFRPAYPIKEGGGL